MLRSPRSLTVIRLLRSAPRAQLSLTERYGPTVALGGIDLQVPAGSILGMLGPNGAGKPVTELRHSLLARPADCRSPGQRSSSRTRPPSWTYCVRERSATRCWLGDRIIRSGE